MGQFNTIPPNPFPPSSEKVGDAVEIEKDIASLETDVENLNDNKANQITIAPFFNAETPYNVGDIVYYNGLSYRCTNAHEGAWDADDFAATTISNELNSLMSGLNNVNSNISRIDNVPLYVTATNDIQLASEASGTISFTKSNFTIPSGYTANWGDCIYSVVGAWGVACDCDACFNSGEPYFTDSNALVVNIKSHVSAGNVNFRAAVSVMITPTT